MSYLVIIFGSSGVIDNAGIKIDDFIVEYLCKFEAISKKALTRLSGAQVGFLMKKTKGRKSRDD
jgi:hypothetical protein